ncbi:phosphoribosyltransferase, partial [Candidatus Kaiserbacteria bacterium]|nr:phosphoribosyltransferase [Candidatus Kaiserbacteria bacterium]
SYDEKTKRRGKLVISQVPRIKAQGKKILLIDEIADTGETFKAVSKVLKEECGAKHIKTAAIVVNTTRCKTLPDFAVMKVDKWVVFPWDA